MFPIVTAPILERRRNTKLSPIYFAATKNFVIIVSALIQTWFTFREFEIIRIFPSIFDMKFILSRCGNKFSPNFVVICFGKKIKS